jgi:DNA-binding beta-propeller fold protein YncE
MASSGAVTSSPRFARFTVLGASRCTAVFEFLCALCAVAEGAVVRAADAAAVSCVPVVLGDALRRLSVFGGRAGMPRSLGSVLSCLIARFLRGSPLEESHRIKTPGVLSISNGIAGTREGAVLVSDYMNHCLVAVEGSRVRVIGTYRTGPLEFSYPRQVWVASDDFVFVADAGNRRVQVLSPCLGFHGFVGDSEHLVYPAGVCADDHAVFVSDELGGRISVFNRADGASLRCFGSRGSRDGQLNTPQGLCFVDNNSRIAVAEYGNGRISVFRVDGTFDRLLGVGVLR